MNEIQQWWQTLVYRERIVVSVLAIVVILFMFQSLILKPLYQARDNAQNSVNKQAELLQWMKQKGALAKQLKRTSPIQSQVKGVSISQRINTTAKRTKIEINRFQTSGDTSVQVWLDSVDFSKLLLWLNTLQSKNGVHIESVAISETSKAGFVSVRSTLTTD